METERYEIGMIGLGVMGRNMLLNMADHGFPVAGYDKDPTKVDALQKEATANDIQAVANIQDLIGLLRRPRAVMMLVPAGPPVDSVIGDLLPHLEKGDLITRSAWLPANLIQAQRDYFGAHRYERIDVKGTFHADWTKSGTQ